jgi:DNA-binding CsgD family transcriptional regulator
MFQVLSSTSPKNPAAPDAGIGARHGSALDLLRTGHLPERRSDAADLTSWLRCMLDEIDYGMLLVSSDAQVLYINHAAQAELDARHPLQLSAHQLHALKAQDTAPLFDALAGAQRGRRKLLLLGDSSNRVSLSVVPLAGGGTLLVLGKRQVCELLSVQGFARSVGLTAAETRVLEGLCNGVRPRDIAERQGVAVSTVRTQIGSIRSKTGVASIRELVRQVAVLPPLVGALKSSAACAAAA